MTRTYLKNNAAEEIAELHVLDDIGPSWAGMVGAKGIAAMLKGIDPKARRLKVLVNSNGGSAFEGIAIHNLLKQHPLPVDMHVLGVAASAASVITMSGDRIIMSPSAFLMIHPVLAIMIGNAAELRKEADVIDAMSAKTAGIYAARSGKYDEKHFTKLMNKETWLDANEALELGLADEIDQSKSTLVNSLRPRLYNFQSIPQQVRSCATLAARVEERLAQIEDDPQDGRDRSAILGDLYRQSQGTAAEGTPWEKILSGRAGCPTDAALVSMASTLRMPADQLRGAAVADGCDLPEEHACSCGKTAGKESAKDSQPADRPRLEAARQQFATMGK